MVPVRRLAAIMFTDIEGYTALMQRSEADAVRIRARHREVFNPVTEKHGGQIVQYYGDGTLSIFESAVSAVECACELQELFLQDPVIPVRIGIHTGDILISEDDIIGDSVNLASRIESMAIAGSVLISSKVLEEIKNQEQLRVKFLGSFHFKNDRQHREVYAINHPGLVVPKIHELRGKLQGNREVSTRAAIATTSSQEDQKDAFISYAPVDDETLTIEEAGWISTFDRALRKRVAQLLGYQPEIWREPHSDSYDEIINEFPKLKVLISILSPHYVESERCLTELKEFHSLAKNHGTLKVDNKWRILKVVKTPVPPEQCPPEIEGILGYDFFEVVQDGHFREFILDKRSPNYYQFLERFEDVAQDLSQLIRSFKAGKLQTETASSKEAVSATPEISVYLAKTTSDLNPVRDNIRRNLEMHGYRVLPEAELPLDSRFRDVVKENLQNCHLAIVLASGKYGMVPEDEEHSVPNLQYELCMESNLPCLIWIPEDMTIEDTRQKAFLDRVHTVKPNHEYTEILNTELEDFKTHLMDTLDQIKFQQAFEKQKELPESRPPRIYLIYDRGDEVAATILDDHLYDLGFEVLTPLFEGTESEVRQVHQDNLRTCDAALIFFGQGSEFWLNAKISDLRKAPGFGRTEPIRKKAVYISGEKNPFKERFRSRELEVLKHFDMFSGEHLHSFENLLKQG